MKKNRTSIMVLLLISIVVGLTNLSQLPFLTERGITQYLSYPVWIILFGACLIVAIVKKIRFDSKLASILLVVVAIVFFQLTFSFITKVNYMNSSMFRYMVFSILIFTAGYCLKGFVDSKIIGVVLIVYVISSFIVEAFVYVDLFRGTFTFAQKAFTYESKNSISLLLTTSCIISLYYLKPKRILLKIINVAFLAFTVYMLLALKSRTCILGIAVSFFVSLFSKCLPNSKKYLFIAIFIVSLVLVIFVPSLNTIVFQNVLFANNVGLNAISSGRVNLFNSFPELFEGNYFMGVGSYYFESAPLSALLQFGVICGSLYILLMCTPIFVFFKHRKNGDVYFSCFLISILYFVNMLFEGIAPFGPGAKCYFLWLLLGLLFTPLHKSIIYDKTKKESHFSNAV